MTQGEDPYPPDEFDDVDPSAGPRGVHRRPRSRWAAVWPYLAALVAAAALAYVVIGLVWDEREVAPTTVSTGPSTDPSDPTGTPTGSATADAPAPDLDTRVVVLNSTTVTGLAAGAAEQLQDAGWTDVGSADFDGATLSVSTVRYASADLEGSARAVADELGVSRVEPARSGTAGTVEVVLGLDVTVVEP